MVGVVLAAGFEGRLPDFLADFAFVVVFRVEKFKISFLIDVEDADFLRFVEG